MVNNIARVLSIVVAAVILALVLRGMPGNPSASDLSLPQWENNGPFALSPERGRYALTYSLIEDHTPFFSISLARFAAPDLGYSHGHFVSLFAPGVSFITMPGYLIGRIYGMAQLATFATVAIFALLNGVLIYLIARRLGGTTWASILGALIFLFATPAFTYAVNLYQHHFSTFLILLALYLVLSFDTWWSFTLVWFLAALSIPLDYPNLFLMFPLTLYSLRDYLRWPPRLSWKLLGIIGVVPPLIFFLWFNNYSYGNPLQFSGTLPSVPYVGEDGRPASAPPIINSDNSPTYLDLVSSPEKSAAHFFQSRYLTNDFYIHLFSPDRGLIYFTPVLLLFLFGIFFLHRGYPAITELLLGIILSDLLLYSLWGDPWGGWAFGSRYLIPAYAIMAILLTYALTRLKKKIIFLILFLILGGYSLAVNTIGALTTDANPPQVEILALEALSHKPEPYSYNRNFSYIHEYGTHSFLYETFFHSYFSPWIYYELILGSLIILLLILVIGLYYDPR